MPMYKGWVPDTHKVRRAGKLGALKSPWRIPCSPERAKQLKAERIERLRKMGIIA